jgi:hypothetical protein
MESVRCSKALATIYQNTWCITENTTP